MAATAGRPVGHRRSGPMAMPRGRHGEYQVFAEHDPDIPPVRVLNPGSATGADPADVATMMTARVENGDVDVVVHEA